MGNLPGAAKQKDKADTRGSCVYFLDPDGSDRVQVCFPDGAEKDDLTCGWLLSRAMEKFPDLNVIGLQTRQAVQR